MDFHFKIGLKIYSTDVALIKDAFILQEGGFFNYVELYTIPYSYEETINAWKEFKVPFVIHAPHSLHGLNLAIASQWEENRQRFMETQRFADVLNTEVVIVHGGHSGTIEETISQIVLLNDSRICLENKPRIGLNNEECVGWSPDEFQRAADAGVLSGGTVLDFGHAACAAFSLSKDPMELVREFLVFRPKVFHLSDGDAASEQDTHLNIGKGSLNITDFLSVVPEGALLTIETPRNSQHGLEDFVNDVRFLWKLPINEVPCGQGLKNMNSSRSVYDNRERY